jgi:hypothetical protein
MSAGRRVVGAGSLALAGAAAAYKMLVGIKDRAERLAGLRDRSSP